MPTDRRPRPVESGRRRPIAYPSAAGPAVLATVGIVVMVIVVGQLTRRPTPPPPAPAAPTAARPISPVPTATVTATATAPVREELASPWIEVAPAPTRTSPPVPTPVPRATRTPRPTPSLAGCVAFGWSTLQTYGPPSAHVNVTIQVDNHCGRELAPLELWFEVRGYRQGELVQVARGHPFDPVGTIFPAELTIGLPGSETWYDRITVEILESR
jgi:hypothetical protein